MTEPLHCRFRELKILTSGEKFEVTAHGLLQHAGQQKESGERNSI